MKGKPSLRLGRDRPDPETLAAEVLGRLAAEPERLGRFLALTGANPATIREAVREPGFLAAVLDHVVQDEALLVAVAAELGLPPQAIADTQARLTPPPDDP